MGPRPHRLQRVCGQSWVLPTPWGFRGHRRRAWISNASSRNDLPKRNLYRVGIAETGRRLGGRQGQRTCPPAFAKHFSFLRWEQIVHWRFRHMRANPSFFLLQRLQASPRLPSKGVDGARPSAPWHRNRLLGFEDRRCANFQSCNRPEKRIRPRIKASRSIGSPSSPQKNRNCRPDIGRK